MKVSSTWGTAGSRQKVHEFVALVRLVSLGTAIQGHRSLFFATISFDLFESTRTTGSPPTRFEPILSSATFTQTGFRTADETLVARIWLTLPSLLLRNPEGELFGSARSGFFDRSVGLYGVDVHPAEDVGAESGAIAVVGGDSA